LHQVAGIVTRAEEFKIEAENLVRKLSNKITIPRLGSDEAISATTSKTSNGGFYDEGNSPKHLTNKASSLLQGSVLSGANLGVALLLQANPILTPDNIHEIIRTTAIEDAHTGNLPNAGNNNWGHGKINAYGAIKKAIQVASGIYSFSGKQLDCILYPNPNNGSFAIDYAGDKSEELVVEIINITGSVVKTDKWPVSIGENRKQLDVLDVAKGFYTVKIASNEGFVNIKTIIR
jgi:hypothetical protein